jgi:hypothetical protein
LSDWSSSCAEGVSVQNYGRLYFFINSKIPPKRFAALSKVGC